VRPTRLLLRADLAGASRQSHVDVATQRYRRCSRIALAAITGVTMSSCQSSFHHTIGTVTNINPDSLCVARHADLGGCFVDPGKRLIPLVHFGDCVDATYVASKTSTEQVLKAIKPVNGAQHRLDCPSPLPMPM
jgi:hypothetical protein